MWRAKYATPLATGECGEGAGGGGSLIGSGEGLFSVLRPFSAIFSGGGGELFFHYKM